MTAPNLLGRAAEILEAERRILDERDPLLIIFGASGVGKTRLAEELYERLAADDRYSGRSFLSVYGTPWAAILSQLRMSLDGIPTNVTAEEFESAVALHFASRPGLLVLDNVDDSNVREVSMFLERWLEADHESTIILTVENSVRDHLPTAWPDIHLRGLSDGADRLELLANLREIFPAGELLKVADLLEGNPQALVFLNWLAPQTGPELWESARNLTDRDVVRAVKDLVGLTGLPALFFLALGVHRDLNVSEDLLTSLWDQFASRGAGPFVATREMLVERGFLLTTRRGHYRLHESVHVNLPKALHHTVGADRVPALHHYLGDYYRRLLQRSPSSTALTQFAYHSREARDFELAFGTLVKSGSGRRLLGDHVTSLQLRSELESLLAGGMSEALAAAEVAELYMLIGSLCNDLSNHRATLQYLESAESHIVRLDDAEVADQLRRELWYISAVARSNLGSSDECLRDYFRIVRSCMEEADRLACLSLGYLAHDLKYRDLATAVDIGAEAVNWARAFDSGDVLAKNLCSYAESLALAGLAAEASDAFREAADQAALHGNARELGRVLINWGFAGLLESASDEEDRIQQGRALSLQVGDRRRNFQAVLYGGVASVLSGNRMAGRATIAEAAGAFMSLDDGRYFTPALSWLLKLDGHETDPQADPEAWLEGESRPDRVEALVSHARAHPEFRVYRDFWNAHLSRLVG